MTRLIASLMIATTLFLCGLTTTVADSTPSLIPTGDQQMVAVATPLPGPDSQYVAVPTPPKAPVAPPAIEDTAAAAPVAVSEASEPRNSIRMKVDAKVYGNPYSEANSSLKPVTFLERIDLHSSLDGRSISRRAAKLSANRLTDLAERCVTGRGEPLLYAA